MDQDQERRALVLARIGTRFGGKFQLDRLLGVGGMAAVYAASHRNGKRVAIKVLHAPHCASQQQRKRFLREAHVANTICHPGVVQIHDDGIEADGAVYLVMELLEGQTLAELHQREGPRLELELVLEVADQLLDVLAVAHERGIVHRDIKPQNLFITANGELKVLDFGIARMFEQVAGATLDTQVGAMLGTPAFMPQEQARGRWDEVEARTDLWAVGATMFTLLSGEFVHVGETPNERIGRAMTVPARSLATVASDLPASFIAVVDRALRFAPEERWRDARSMQAALRAVRAELHGGDAASASPIEQSHASAAQGEITTVGGQRGSARTGGATRASRAGALFALAAAVVVLWQAVAWSSQAALPTTRSGGARAAQARTELSAASFPGKPGTLAGAQGRRPTMQTIGREDAPDVTISAARRGSEPADRSSSATASRPVVESATTVRRRVARADGASVRGGSRVAAPDPMDLRH
jgi:eukaryotic-like serine/threonine-protein kinase